MKKLDKYSRAAAYLEKIFRELNKDWFSGELEEPIITIQSTPSAYGHVTYGKVWKKNEDEERCEMNIGAGTLARPIENIVATIMHESVHLYNLQRGVKDCSRGGTYHNKKFKAEAEKRGLKIDHHEKYGWTITEPTEELIEYIIGEGWENILLQREEPLRIIIGGKKGKEGGGSPDGGERKKSSTRKYVCPDCGQTVRATKDVNIICADCMERMVQE